MSAEAGAFINLKKVTDLHRYLRSLTLLDLKRLLGVVKHHRKKSYCIEGKSYPTTKLVMYISDVMNDSDLKQIPVEENTTSDSKPLDTGDPKALNEGPQTTTEPKVKRTGQKIQGTEEENTAGPPADPGKDAKFKNVSEKLAAEKDKMAPAIEQTKDNPNQKDPKDPASWLSLPVVMPNQVTSCESNQGSGGPTACPSPEATSSSAAHPNRQESEQSPEENLEDVKDDSTTVKETGETHAGSSNENMEESSKKKILAEKAPTVPDRNDDQGPPNEQKEVTPESSSSSVAQGLPTSRGRSDDDDEDDASKIRPSSTRKKRKARQIRDSSSSEAEPFEDDDLPDIDSDIDFLESPPVKPKFSSTPKPSKLPKKDDDMQAVPVKNKSGAKKNDKEVISRLTRNRKSKAAQKALDQSTPENQESEAPPANHLPLENVEVGGNPRKVTSPRAPVHKVSDADNLETAVTKPTGDVLPRMRARKLQGQKTVTRTKTGNGIHKTKKGRKQTRERPSGSDRQESIEATPETNHVDLQETVGTDKGTVELPIQSSGWVILQRRGNNVLNEGEGVPDVVNRHQLIIMARQESRDSSSKTRSPNLSEDLRDNEQNSNLEAGGPKKGSKGRKEEVEDLNKENDRLQTEEDNQQSATDRLARVSPNDSEEEYPLIVPPSPAPRVEPSSDPDFTPEPKRKRKIAQIKRRKATSYDEILEAMTAKRKLQFADVYSDDEEEDEPGQENQPARSSASPQEEEASLARSDNEMEDTQDCTSETNLPRKKNVLSNDGKLGKAMKASSKSRKGKNCRFTCHEEVDGNPCGLSFVSKHNLLRHSQRHQQIDPDDLKCPKCEKVFFNTDLKKTHVKRQCAPYKCPYDGCGKEYEKVNSLLYHKRTFHKDVYRVKSQSRK